MAASRKWEPALEARGFRRIWAALGRPDDDGRSVAEVALDHAPSASPANEDRTFRLLDTGSEDLLDRERTARGAVATSADGTASTIRAVVKPFAGWAASIVAAAAGMTFLFPPGEADAYHYFSHQGHFDHAKKEQIVMSLGTVGYMPPLIYDSWTDSVNQWNAWTVDSIKITATVEPVANTRMTIRASYWNDTTTLVAGFAKHDTPDSNRHWVRIPAIDAKLNVGWFNTKASDTDRPLVARTAASHEVGHALGLAHTGEEGCSGVEWNEGIMQDSLDQTYYKCDFVRPQSDDTAGVDKLYTAAGK